LLVIAGLFITYRLVPRGRASWRTALLAAVLVAIALRVAQFVFSILLGRVMDFDEGYGPLAGVATLATWAFFASAIVIIGAELVATLDRHRLVHLPLPSSRRGDPRERGSADGIVESEPDEDQPPRT
jgi:membrane protein